MIFVIGTVGGEQIIDKGLAKTLMKPEQFKLYEDSLSILKQSQQRELTIFYLTTHSLTSGVKNFNAQVKKLNDRGDKIEGMVVLRGFPDDLKKFIEDIYSKDIPGIVKIHPKIFKSFNITRVPAFVLSYCPVGENFAFAQCETKFVAIGDITLSDFLFRVSETDKDYSKYYFDLIRPQ